MRVTARIGTFLLTVAVIVGGGCNSSGGGGGGPAPPATVNTPPVAADVAVTTDEDAPVTVDVLANDTDPDNDSLRVDVFTDPASGTVNRNGSMLSYTPDADFNGTDTFSYTVVDDKDEPATGDAESAG